MADVISIRPDAQGDGLDEIFEEQATRRSAAEEDGRVSIEITAKESEVVEKAGAALAKDPDLYQRAKQLVHVTEEAKPPRGIQRSVGAPAIDRIPRAVLRTRLTRLARFKKWVESREDLVDAHPPDWAIDYLHTCSSYPEVRPLTAVVTTPVLLPDHSVLTTPGYHADSGILYRSNGIHLEINTGPTREDAIRAVAVLREIFCDFPFASPADFSVILSGLLSLLTRFAFPGPAPLHALDGSTRGVGKTLLVDLISLIAFGWKIAKMPPCNDEEEWRKRIMTIALTGELAVLIDNVRDTLGDPSLDAALTTDGDWTDRRMGKMESASAPLTAVFFCTGNNLQFGEDTARRTIKCRLNSPLEHPEARSGFTHPDIVRHVLANRKSLLEAALTIPLAYCRAGMPDQASPKFGSFEGWSDLVRSGLIWAGCEDPCLTNKEAQKADTTAAGLPALFHGLRALDPETKGLGTADILDAVGTVGTFSKEAEKHKALRRAIEGLCPGHGKPLPDARQFGRFLGKHKQRVCGGYRLNCRELTGQTLWFVEQIGSSSSQQDQPNAEAPAPVPATTPTSEGSTDPRMQTFIQRVNASRGKTA